MKEIGRAENGTVVTRVYIAMKSGNRWSGCTSREANPCVDAMGCKSPALSCQKAQLRTRHEGCSQGIRMAEMPSGKTLERDRNPKGDGDLTTYLNAAPVASEECWIAQACKWGCRYIRIEASGAKPRPYRERGLMPVLRVGECFVMCDKRAALESRAVKLADASVRWTAYCVKPQARKSSFKANSGTLGNTQGGDWASRRKRILRGAVGNSYRNHTKRETDLQASLQDKAESLGRCALANVRDLWSLGEREALISGKAWISADTDAMYQSRTGVRVTSQMRSSDEYIERGCIPKNAVRSVSEFRQTMAKRSSKLEFSNALLWRPQKGAPF